VQNPARATGTKKAGFARQDYNAATISYDNVDVLKAFAARACVSYPMLSDPESKIIRDFGILNESMPKGPFYGVPHPGVYIVDAKGVVRKRFFEVNYRERYTASSMLFRTAPQALHDGWTEIETRHLKLRYRGSDT
jgi:peroxiredoxin